MPSPTHTLLPTLSNGLTISFACIPDSEGAHWGSVTLGGVIELDAIGELDAYLTPRLAGEVRAMALAMGKRESVELRTSDFIDWHAWRTS